MLRRLPLKCEPRRNLNEVSRISHCAMRRNPYTAAALIGIRCGERNGVFMIALVARIGHNVLLTGLAFLTIAFVMQII